MKLPLHIETAAEYYCKKIVARIKTDTRDGSVVRMEVPKIKNLIKN